VTATPAIRLSAFVGPTEAPAVEDAARRLTEALAAAGAPASAVQVEFVASLGELRDRALTDVAIVSLLPEVEAALRDWPAAEARLMRKYAALARRLDAELLFLCTVFRHAPTDLDEDARIALQIAIRRLDLLAVHVSHATGLNVIDLDRAFAHVGALSLETDYRLTGEAATEAAGAVIAAAVLEAGLEDRVSAPAAAGTNGA